MANRDFGTNPAKVLVINERTNLVTPGYVRSNSDFSILQVQNAESMRISDESCESLFLKLE